jgi:hypothetical protein
MMAASLFSSCNAEIEQRNSEMVSHPPAGAFVSPWVTIPKFYLKKSDRVAIQSQCDLREWRLARSMNEITLRQSDFIAEQTAPMKPRPCFEGA